MDNSRDNVRAYEGLVPSVHPEAYVDSSAVVIGDVTIGARSSIWPCAVLRGDQGSIALGVESNIQDGAVVHATRELSVVQIGDRVTVGHQAVLHGCTIMDDCLIGIGAVVLDNCVVGTGSVIGAGTVVPKGKQIPERSLVLGVPGKVVRTLTEEEVRGNVGRGHTEYVRLTRQYRDAALQRSNDGE